MDWFLYDNGLRHERVNGLGKYTTFFDDVWYYFIHMKSKVELAF